MWKRLTLISLIAATLVLPARATTLNDVIAKNLETRGGKAKLLAITSVTITGTVRMSNGMEMPMVFTWKRPNKLRVETTIQGIKVIQAYDGKHAWMIVPFSGSTDPQPMPPDQAKIMAEQADFDGPFIDGEKKGYTLQLVGQKEVEGTPAYKVKVTNKYGDVVFMYLDTEYCLPFKMEGERTVRGQKIEFEGTIGDYKKVGGILFPFSTSGRQKGTNKGQTTTFKTITLNPKIDDSEFAMPAAKPAAPAAGKKK